MDKVRPAVKVTRRAFIETTAAATAGAALSPSWAAAADRMPAPPGARTLVERFVDLPRHFVFEYYPWYAADPFRHWEELGRRPPVDLASNYMPRLGAYDSRATAVLEQHARWMAGSGAGGVNVSWWGRDSDIDRLVPTLMDVMAAHGLRVTFHLEPYGERHAFAYASDIEYLVRQYGDRRRWDAFLLLEDADGRVGPVFKSFRTILPARTVDCHGVTSDVADYAADAAWRAQTDAVRQLLAGDFHHVTLLADSLDFARAAAGGFDGIAIYDNYVEPSSWERHAEGASARNLLFSFNVNPGFDGAAPRDVEPGSCYTPLPFAPAGNPLDFSRADGREAAAARSRDRIAESLRTTIVVQTSMRLANARRGFFLAYINSFNEWHEGHQFEPMQPWSALTPDERAAGYHNPEDGAYRLEALTELLGSVFTAGRGGR